MTVNTVDDKYQEASASNQLPDIDQGGTKGPLNEISIIRFKMNKFKVAVMLATKLTKEYRDGYLNAQREVMLTGLSLYARLYDIGYVDRDRYTKDVLDLVGTYEKHLKEAPLIASIRQIRSSGQTGVNLNLTREERDRYIGKFSISETMNRVMVEAQAEARRPRVGGLGSTETAVNQPLVKPVEIYHKQTEPSQTAHVQPSEFRSSYESQPTPNYSASPLTASARPKTDFAKSDSLQTRLASRSAKDSSQRARQTILSKLTDWLQ